MNARRILALLATVVAVHLLTVWAAPRLIMQVLMNGPAAKTMDMRNQAAFPPAVTAASRSVVLPSPDMLYSVCVFDLTTGPLRIHADPKLKSYWSIALYADNSDNFFVINDKQAQDKPVALWLVPPDSEQHAATSPVPLLTAPEGNTLVRAPSTQGFLLMRVLTGNYDAEKSIVEPARRSLRCEKAW